MRQLLFLTFLLVANGAFAQLTMSDILRSMPDSLLPYLTANNRLDLIDFKEAQMKAVVRNAQDGKSELVTLSEHFAELSLNEAHRLQLRLFDVVPVHDDLQHVVCVVDTYGTVASESTLRFFSPTWQPLDAAQFVALPAQPFTATLHEVDDELILTPSAYYDRPAIEDQEVVTNFPIKLKWTANSFK